MRNGWEGELRLWPKRRLVIEEAEGKQKYAARVARVEGRLRRIDACWADAGGGMRSRDFVGDRWAGGVWGMVRCCLCERTDTQHTQGEIKQR